MASINALTISSSTLVSKNTASRSPFPIGLGPHSLLSPTLALKTLSSKSSLVVKAQQGGNPEIIDPIKAERFNKKVALVDTSPYVRTPWNTDEDENEIRMWFDMPGLAAENIDVNVVDDMLVIKGEGGIDAYGNKIFSPYESRVHLPFHSWKEEITAVFKNGVLYITVPKIHKLEHKVIHIPVRSIVIVLFVGAVFWNLIKSCKEFWLRIVGFSEFLAAIENPIKQLISLLILVFFRVTNLWFIPLFLLRYFILEELRGVDSPRVVPVSS